MSKKSWLAFHLRNLCLGDQDPGIPKRSKRALDRFSFNEFHTSSALEGTLVKVSEEQRKHALDVARITAVAADAAVVAAHVAAQVVQLTGSPSLYNQHKQKEALAVASVKIQSAFRAYLARKALRALKAVVRLQAIARGRSVRRQMTAKSRHYPFRALQVEQNKDRSRTSENKEKVGNHIESWLQWNDSMLSKEEVESASLKQKEAIIRRERIKRYSFSHRERECPQLGELFPRPCRSQALAYLANQWTKDNVNRSNKPEDLSPIFISNRRVHELDVSFKLKERNSSKGYYEEESSSSSSRRKRSYGHVRQRSSGDDNLLMTHSPFPSYMAVTESAKAKVVRSMSTPRELRHGRLNTTLD
ncbi:hypothetical protein Droror1_Dr00012823 [Drosera rotundifolia]